MLGDSRSSSAGKGFSAGERAELRRSGYVKFERVRRHELRAPVRVVDAARWPRFVRLTSGGRVEVLRVDTSDHAVTAICLHPEAFGGALPPIGTIPEPASRWAYERARLRREPKRALELVQLVLTLIAGGILGAFELGEKLSRPWWVVSGGVADAARLGATAVLVLATVFGLLRFLKTEEGGS